MDRIILFLLSLLLAFSLAAQERGKPTLEDFIIEKIPVPERKSAYYQLILKEPDRNIAFRLLAKPEKIIESYFDEKYLVLVYKAGRYNHYLTGAYYDGEKWVEDYFHRQLGGATGISARVVKTAKFIDGETLMIEYELSSSMEENNTYQYSIYRICKNRIFEYTRRDPFGAGAKSNPNPIRPID